MTSFLKNTISTIASSEGMHACKTYGAIAINYSHWKRLKLVTVREKKNCSERDVQELHT